jgi:hypothetical protein
MFESPCAKLVLRTFDLPGGGEPRNNTGFASVDKISCTWTNIDLKLVLGEKLYEEYGEFNLVLNSVYSPSTLDVGTTADDRNLLVYASGLVWKNQGYNCVTKLNEQECLVGGLNYKVGSGLQYSQTICPNMCTFSKTSNLSALTINLVRTLDGAPPESASTADYNFTYTFSIYGIESATRKKRPLYLN